MQHEFYFPDEISVYIVEHLEQNLLLPMIEVLYVDPIDKKETKYLNRKKRKENEWNH